MTDHPASTAPAAAAFPLVKGRCPACNGSSLFLGAGGYVTCSRLDCPDPTKADDMLHRGKPEPGSAATEATPLAVPRAAATDLHRALGQLLGDQDAQTITRVRDLHRQEYEACAWCSTNDRYVPWPCPTVRALDGEEQPGA